MTDLFTLYQAICVPPTPAEILGAINHRPCIGETRMSNRQYERRKIEKQKTDRIENIAVLDMETDPFDKKSKAIIKPFLAVLYRDGAEPVIIWDENNERFVTAVLRAIENLPGKFTVYAHNGGKFDYMFLLHRLRGFVSFKGRSIMSAKIGRHEIRDSYHIIPERLANIQKDKIQYEKMKRGARDKHREEIIHYCISDCAYLLDVVKKFVREFGLKLSIGQAAIAELRKNYKVARLGENSDAFLRNYFFGGRVECLQGRGVFGGETWREPYKLYDVNSMYPNVMANYAHPIGNEFVVRRGGPTPQTIFMELECKNFGALVKRGDDGEITADYEHGSFRTTVWEYEAARRHGLIENVKIKWCIDFPLRSNFEKFVLPLYAKRQVTKHALKTLQEGSAAYLEMKKDDIFYKLIMNNAYGKFAQNPRRFKECYLTAPDEIPALEDCSNAVKQLAVMRPELANGSIMKEWGQLPEMECNNYWVWSRPTPHMRFFNVATAASITGAARATLLDAIASADDAIYCDTDSLICRGLRGVEIHNENLGAWKVESVLDEVIVAGKKLYAYKVAGISDGQPGRVKVRSKGVQDVTWNDLVRMLNSEIVPFVNPAPTFTKMSTQNYMTRNVRATVGTSVSRIVKRKRAIG